MSKKSSHKGKKQYGIYKELGRFSKNKLLKLERQVRENPNDSQASESLMRLKKHCPHTRKAPMNSIWSKTAITFAQYLTKVGFSGKLALQDDVIWSNIEKS